MAPKWRHSQMKTSWKGAVHLRKKSKADLDIDMHYTDSSDPCTLRKSWFIWAVTGLGSLVYKAGDCPVRNLKSHGHRYQPASQIGVRPEVHAIMKGPLSCIPPYWPSIAAEHTWYMPPQIATQHFINNYYWNLRERIWNRHSYHLLKIN